MYDNKCAESIINMRNRTVRLDRAGDYWTEDEKSQLKLLFETGVGISDIAVQLQRTEPAIMQQVEKMDLYNRKASPMRRKSAPKEPVCLCNNCQLDRASCPYPGACPRCGEEA